MLACLENLPAQWTTNTLVNTEASNTSTSVCKTMSTSDGKTWMAYYKNVPAPNYFEMRAQLLDKDGVKLLGPEGVLVNNAQHSSFTTVNSAIVDAGDNLIIAFSTTVTPNVVYVNKISTAGTQVWSSAGTSITNALNPKLGVLSNGDVIVSWIPQSGATTNRTFMQRLAAGTGAQLWPSPVSVEPANPAHRTVCGHIMTLSGNDFIHVFHNRTGTAGLNSTLWAQRYTAAGNPVWAAPVQLADKSTVFNREYSPEMHNDTLFLGYFAATGLRQDAFLQRLNPNGTIPWGINGSDFATNNTYYEMDISLAIVPSSNIVWATSRLTSTSQGNQGTYVQQFNKSTGARLLTDNGKAVFNIIPPPYVTPVGMTLFSDNLPVIMLTKYNTAVNQFLYATKLDNNGGFVWPGDTVALGKFPATKGRMNLTRAVGDMAVAGWVETKGSLPLPYAQPIYSNGTTGLLPPVASFTVNNEKVCRNSPVQFNSTSTGFVETYAWSFPGGTPSVSAMANPVVTYPANGIYTATLTVTNAGGSTAVTRFDIVNVVGITASAGPDKILVDGYSIGLDGSSTGGNPASVNWTPNTSITGANTLHPTVNPHNTTTYSLTLTDDNNCTSVDQALVTVLPYCVKPMNAFTPNGDGMNDVWVVTTNGGACVSRVVVAVYNRYGGLVFRDENYRNNWNGTYKGKPVADGTYYYVITYNLVNDKPIFAKGDVTIIR